MLKTLVLFAALTASASAADLKLPTKAAPLPPIGGCSWCGFYVGFDGGGGWSRANFTDMTQQFDFGSLKPTGLILGGHAGYLWQPGNGPFVVGLELAGAHWGLKKSGVLVPGEVAPILTDRIDIQYTAAARAVVGLGFGSALLYVSGGPAFAHTDGQLATTPAIVILTPVPVPLAAGTRLSAPTNHFGWNANVGLKYKLSDNWLIGVEGGYADYGRSVYDFGAGITANGRLTAPSLLGRLDYRF